MNINISRIRHRVRSVVDEWKRNRRVRKNPSAHVLEIHSTRHVHKGSLGGKR